MKCSKIYAFNAQSVLAHIDEIGVFIEEQKPLTVILSETCLTDGVEDFEINMDGYNCVRVDSNSRYTGGVVMYIREDVKHRVVKRDVLQKNYWVLVCKLTCKNFSATIVAVYRSPSSGKSLFLDYYEQLCDELVSSGLSNIIVVGDFNIDWSSNDLYSNRLKRDVSDCGMVQLVEESTHIMQNSRTIIDLLITNIQHLKIEIISEPGYTNHKTIVVDMKGEHNIRVKKIRRKVLSREEANEHIVKLNWRYDVTDVETKADIVYQNLNKLINLIMPEKEIVVSNNKSWFNNRVKNAISRRNEAHKRSVARNNPQDWEAFKTARNEVVSIIRKEKRRYYENKIDRNKQNPKEMWKTLKGLVAGKDNVNINNIKFQGKEENDLQVIVNCFNDYFIESINEVSASIRQCNIQFEIVRAVNDYNSFKLIEIVELEKIVSSLANKGSPDGITIGFIKDYFEELKWPIINFINLSIEKSKIPSNLKISTIVPIRKVPGSNKCEDFRPVNMLPALEKILEKVIYNQLIKYVKKNNILMEVQSGFREGYSCETAIQCVLSNWKECRDRGLSVVVVFLDLKRAFETIDRQRLLMKLSKMGISGEAWNWLNDYLTDRKQKVKCGDVISEEKDINMGVPQGSILGPLLFALYINDLGTILKLCKCHLFADDTVIYLEGINIMEIIDTVNRELKMVSDWFAVNKLKLNLNKTKAMCLTSNNVYLAVRDNNINVMIDGEPVEFVEKIKYLGVMLDYRLSLNEHVNYISSKIGRRMGLLARLKYSLTCYSKLTIYNTIILPYYYNCGTVLYLVNQGGINRLQILQNRGMRIILGCRWDTNIKEMLINLEWLNVHELLMYQMFIFVYKMINGLMPSYFNKYVIRCNEIHSYNTRGRDNLYVQGATTNIGYNSVVKKGVILFNKLDNYVKQASSVVVFKRRVKEAVMRSRND